MSYNLSAIENRIQELQEDDTVSLGAIFNIVCTEFNINGNYIASLLDCRCPYGLIGYLEAEMQPELD